MTLTIACGRIQASYAGGLGPFNHLKGAIVLDGSGNPHTRRIFDALIDEYERSGAAAAAMMTALMTRCLIEVLRQVETQSDGALPRLSALGDPRLSTVVEVMLNHPEQPFSLESLAELAAMSQATSVRRFEKCFALTPMDYLGDLRLRQAAHLRRTGAFP